MMTPIRCGCDFCSGRKSWSDNWCARCGQVKLGVGKSYENVDVCDACDEAIRREVREEATRTLSP